MNLLAFKNEFFSFNLLETIGSPINIILSESRELIEYPNWSPGKLFTEAVSLTVLIQLIGSAKKNQSIRVFEL